MRKGLIGVLNIAGATLLNGAAWGQCEVAQIADTGGVGFVSIDGDVAVVGDTEAFGPEGCRRTSRIGCVPWTTSRVSCTNGIARFSTSRST